VAPKVRPDTAARAVAAPRIATTTTRKSSHAARPIAKVWPSSNLCTPAVLGG
jgi:hypothetical protein